MKHTFISSKAIVREKAIVRAKTKPKHPPPMRVKVKDSLKQRSHLIYTDINRKMQRYFWDATSILIRFKYDVALLDKSCKNSLESGFRCSKY